MTPFDPLGSFRRQTQADLKVYVGSEKTLEAKAH
jgi:hypothetical protein